MASAERWGTVRLNFDYISRDIVFQQAYHIANGIETSFNVHPHLISWVGIRGGSGFETTRIDLN